MALPWLALLKHVPWNDVIANAPKVAEGARKLWKGEAGKQATPVLDEHEEGVLPADADAGARLAAKVVHLETRLAQVEEQLRASSELIDALAGQNAQLVSHIQAQDKRLAWVVRGIWLLAALAVAALSLALGT